VDKNRQFLAQFSMPIKIATVSSSLYDLSRQFQSPTLGTIFHPVSQSAPSLSVFRQRPKDGVGRCFTFA